MEGRFLPIKEIAASGVGGMGLHFMFSFFPNRPEFIPGNELYNPEMVMPIFTQWMNTATWICAISFLLSTIPLLFYDLTEKKHKECMEIVKQRVEAANAQEKELSSEN